MDKLYPWTAEVDVSGSQPGTYTFVALTDDPSDGEGAGPTEDTKTIVVIAVVKLSRRRLNRTLLHRQHLLERTTRPARDARHLVGLQAQENLPPYLSWPPGSRTSTRTTSPAARGPLAGPVPDDARHRPPAHRRRRADAAPVDRPCTSGRSRSARASGPPATSTATRSRGRHAELLADGPLPQKALGWRWPSGSPPTRPPSSASWPGRSLRWSRSRRAARGRAVGGVVYQYVDRWVGPTAGRARRRGDRPSLPAAFGPASAADVTAWSGGHRPGPVLKGWTTWWATRTRTARALRRADGELADEDAPAPVRLLGTTTTSGSPTPAATGSPTPKAQRLDGRERRWPHRSSSTAGSRGCGGSTGRVEIVERWFRQRSELDDECGASGSRRGVGLRSTPAGLAEFYPGKSARGRPRAARGEGGRPVEPPPGAPHRAQSAAASDRTAGQTARPAPAVEVRSTSAPSRTTAAPASSKAATSSWVRPPSGRPPRRLAGRGHVDAAEAVAGVLVQHHGEVGLRDQGDDVGGRGQRRRPRGQDRRACLAASRAVACHVGQGLRGALALPDRDGARRGPRHDPADADLGEHLDRELAPVALGQRLDDGDAGSGVGLGDRRRRRAREDPLAGGGDRTGDRGARAVGEDDRSPSRRRRTATAWCASSPVDLDRPARRRRRPATARGGPAATSGSSVLVERVAQPAEHRLARPASTWPSGCSSPRMAASSRSSSSWRGRAGSGSRRRW